MIIDIHGHLGKTVHGHPPLTVEWMLEYMDRNGIEKSVVLPLVAPEEQEYYYTTEHALEDCAKHPDRLIPFANMDPRRGSNDGNYDFYPVLKEYAEMGCKGFGEILANLPTNDSRMKGIYRACGKLGFPVLFDFAMAKRGVLDPVGLPWLEECLQEFPDTIFIGHGTGWWCEISSAVKPEDKCNYPVGDVVPPGRIDYLLEKYPNMYADLSANSAYTALTRSREYGRSFVLKHYKKLMFGTDHYVNGYMDDPIMIRLIGEMNLPADAERAIFAENTLALLK